MAKSARQADQPGLFDIAVAAQASAAEAEFHNLTAARKAAEACTRCPLYKNATQTVFGEGPVHAPVVFVGEQPGD